MILRKEKGLEPYEVKSHAFQWFMIGFMIALLIAIVLGYGGDGGGMGD